MSRATTVYIVVLLVSGAGLWLILRAGSHLHAPTDLTGVWAIGGEDPATLDALGDTVTIEQSGIFFQMTFKRGLTVDLRLVDETPADETANKTFGLLFAGEKWQLNALGESADGPFIFHLTGPQRHTFTVSRSDAS